MKITNKYNLPKPFVKMAESDYQPTPNRYSVTTLLKPVREIILSRRHYNEMEQDIADMTWALFGTAVHKILEDYGENTSEVFLTVPIGKYEVSGRIDLIDGDTVIDYKTTSIWKFKMGDFSDWEKQTKMYAFLLTAQGTLINHGKIIAILRDHRNGEARKDFEYPHPIETITFDFDDYSDIEYFIRQKLASINEYADKPDDELPACTDEERWARNGGYAVMKKGRKSALRLLSSQEDAEEWKEANGGDFIEYRPPYYAKCEDYCPVAKWCDIYNKNRKGND